MSDLSNREKLAWLRLIRSDGIGPVTFRRLLARCGGAEAALEALPELAKASGRRKPFRAYAIDSAKAELDSARKIGANFVADGEAAYPEALSAISDAPPLICCLGHPHLLAGPAVAIVGARNASAVGRKIAREIASGLGDAGYTVVSGLARGIDGVAHQAALEAGTVAAVAGGVDQIYPPEHADLHAAIAAQGAIVSERPIGYAPQGRDFPRRNRLISGLSLGVVVIEAARRSGTLITARFALEQGRDVFAVPGSPLDPRCQGTNKLIQDGAMLVQSAADVCDALESQRFKLREPKPFSDYETETPGEIDAIKVRALREALMELLGPTPVHRDDLIREANAPPGALADALLELVLAGEVVESGGGYFARYESG